MSSGDAIATVIDLHARTWTTPGGRRVYEGRALGQVWRVVRDTDLDATS